MKHISNYLTNQAQVKKSPINPGFSLTAPSGGYTATYKKQFPIPDQELSYVIPRLSRRENFVLNRLLMLSNNCLTVCPSQAWISKTGYSVATVKRALDDLVAKGLVQKFYRHLTTSIYRLARDFYDPRIRLQLSPFLAALRSFTIGLLISTPTGRLQRSELLQDNDLYLLNYITIKESMFNRIKIPIIQKQDPQQPSAPEKPDMALKDLPVNPIINKIPFDLTDWGRQYFDCYHPEVIESALKKEHATIDQLKDFCAVVAANRGQPHKIQAWNWLKKVYENDNPQLLKSDTKINKKEMDWGIRTFGEELWAQMSAKFK